MVWVAVKKDGPRQVRGEHVGGVLHRWLILSEVWVEHEIIVSVSNLQQKLHHDPRDSTLSDPLHGLAASARASKRSARAQESVGMHSRRIC